MKDWVKRFFHRIDRALGVLVIILIFVGALYWIALQCYANFTCTDQKMPMPWPGGYMNVTHSCDLDP